MKRKKIFITLLCTTCMIAGISGSVFAANGFNSQGSISFAGTDEQVGTSDDIIFDSNDLNTIYDEVSTGKNLLATQITSKGAEVNKAGTIYTFNELKLGIDNVYNRGFLDAKEEIDSTKILKGQSILGIAGTATSDADAVAGDIRSGKTAYIDGVKVVGTGHIDPANILYGTEVMGITGTATSGTTATEDNLPTGVTAVVNGQTITGNGKDIDDAYVRGYQDKVADIKAALSAATVLHQHRDYTGTVRDVSYSAPSAGGCFMNGHPNTGWVTCGGNLIWDNYDASSVICQSCGNVTYTTNGGPYPTYINGEKCTHSVQRTTYYYTCSCGKTAGESIDSVNLELIDEMLGLD
ncbi:MAG: hypothetical protein J5525_12640 [Lachnospiraceae bacterium]|nr:hypothetical protein [Lachnospiraceae bacterium]